MQCSGPSQCLLTQWHDWSDHANNSPVIYIISVVMISPNTCFPRSKVCQRDVHCHCAHYVFFGHLWYSGLWWNAGQQVEESILHQGLIHNKINFISQGCPGPSITLQCRIVWHKTPFISLIMHCKYLYSRYCFPKDKCFSSSSNYALVWDISLINALNSEMVHRLVARRRF